MIWDSLKQLLSSYQEGAEEIPQISWVELGHNHWGERVLDVRPVTLNMLSTSQDPQCATNSLSFTSDDGKGFIGNEPPGDRRVKAKLRFPVDPMLANGVLFSPREMEQKWALFYHLGQIFCVRSWTRKVQLVARITEYDGYIQITEIRGYFLAEDEDPEFTVRMMDYLLRSHALNSVYPVPLPPGMESDPKAAAMYCMSMFGNRALIAAPYEFLRRDPESPLRTHSMLHIAVAKGDVPGIEDNLAAGVPVDLLAGDGLAPIHWALACSELDVIALLLDRGSPVDARTREGATPLMVAVQSNSVEHITFLLDHGADVNAQDQRGFTAIHRGAEMGFIEVVKLLIERGASVNTVAEGFTPRSLAEGKEEAEIVALLDEYM